MGGGAPLQFLVDQLTLYQPGAHIIPTQYYLPQKFSVLATSLHTSNLGNKLAIVNNIAWNIWQMSLCQNMTYFHVPTYILIYIF